MRSRGYRGQTMPTFPAFRQRLDQINKPLYAGVAETPMEFGMPMGGPSQNPMRRRRPMGTDGQAVPMIQPQQQANPSSELPMSSGTGAAPAATTGRSMMDAIKKKVAGEVRFEDISPKMEEIPGTPAFNPKEVKGVGGRIKAAFQAAGAASQMNPGSPYAGLVGLAAGAIKPGIAQGLDYQYRVLPEAHRRQAEVMQRNDARQKSFGIELQNRERLAKINQMNDPEWSSVAGGEYPSLYDKRSGETRQVMGPDGTPLKNASILNTETRTESAEEIAHKKRLADAERDVAKKQADFEKAQQRFEFDKEKQEMEARHRKELEELRQSGQNKRAGQSNAVRVSEGEKNRKLRKEIADKKTGRGRGASDEPTKPIERFPNIFQTPQNQFGWPPKGNKLPTN